MQSSHRPKRILVDGASLALEMKGVGRYTANVLREWSTQDWNQEYKILVEANKQLPPLPQGDRFEYVPTAVFDHFRHGWLTLPRLARMFNVDAAWIPYETTLGRFPCPYAMVCHDAPELIRNSQRAGGEQLNLGRKVLARMDHFLIPRALGNAAVVFANSHFVSDWLRETLHLPGERIRYAPCAPGANFAELSAHVNRDVVRETLSCPEGYVLVFATGDRRENFETVLQVFDGLAARTNLNLVIGGTRGGEAEKIRARIQTFSWSKRLRILPFFGESAMQALANVYASATVYLDLSLHEGFGMQVIEAMACGTPVVCSDRGAQPEVAGAAALLVNPENVTEIVNAVTNLLNNEKMRQGLIESGRGQAARYTWAQTAYTIAESIARSGVNSANLRKDRVIF